SACRRRLRTPSRTRSACASPSCRSPRRRSTAPCGRRRATRCETESRDIEQEKQDEHLITHPPFLIPQVMTASRVIRFTLNGEAVSAEAPTHWNVVELLQNRFGLFGARESCGQGLCGCCTVLVNGRAVSGCLYLAALLDGADVRTIEERAD